MDYTWSIADKIKHAEREFVSVVAWVCEPRCSLRRLLILDSIIKQTRLFGHLSVPGRVSVSENEQVLFHDSQLHAPT